MEFGKRVRMLRQAKQLSREEFCDNEHELSVRQLTRIEKGQSIPTLTKVSYIANRLGVKIGDLTDDLHFELPEGYQRLKFRLLRTQTYLDPNRIRQCEAHLDEIFEQYYDNLPEEEQVIVEVLRSRLDYAIDTGNSTAKKILDEYLEQVKKKVTYQLNDLILINLYLTYLSHQDFSEDSPATPELQHIIDTLLETGQILPISEFFVLIPVVSSAASNCMIRKDLLNLDALLTTMEQLMHQAQDFQKMPSFNLLKWKYHLLKGNLELAEKHYQNACFFARITQDEHLASKLTVEWEHDIQLQKN